MDQKTIMGTITFIHHDKITPPSNTPKWKKKSINGNINEKEQLKLKEQKIIKKVHAFHIGDEVSFIITPSIKGDKLVADCIEFRFNNAYTNLLHKASIENRFVGYLKKVDDDYFVKETGSYILFPLVISPWETAPHESRLNEPVFFKLDHLEKPNHITASFFRSEYIPEYQTAVRHFNNNTPLAATVYKVSPFGIFVNLISDKIQAKISVPKTTPGRTIESKVGDTIQVKITYISPIKIVVEKLDDL